MSSMNKFVNNRLSYLDKCRTKIRVDKGKAEKQIEDYFDKVVRDTLLLKAKKLEELEEVHSKHDNFMKKNEQACRKFIEISRKILNINPDSLYEVLKQYNMSNGFIKSIANGVNFPSEQKVDITMKIPAYSIVTNTMKDLDNRMVATSTGLAPNIRERINPLEKSDILPLRSQNDTNLSVLPNFKETELLFKLKDNKMTAK